jgi:hypothetical protein
MLLNYITASKDTPSRSGLYANQLPGVTLRLLDDLTKDEQEDWEEFWEDIYQRSIINFVSEVQGKLADKFNVDLVLFSRETSEFRDELNDATETAGITLEYALPKYGVVHVVQIEVFAEAEQTGKVFTFYKDNADGRVLYTKTVDLEEGLNTINIDQDFAVDKLFIGFDPTSVSVLKTKNKYFDNELYFEQSDTSCIVQCTQYGRGSFSQKNGGGLNVIYNVHCSISKFVEDNINIFKEAFWYRIGLELVRERILSDRINRWTILTLEEAEQKQAVFVKECELKLDNAIRSLRLKEDPTCFACKSVVYSSYLTP